MQQYVPAQPNIVNIKTFSVKESKRQHQDDQAPTTNIKTAYTIENRNNRNALCTYGTYKGLRSKDRDPQTSLPRFLIPPG